MNVLLAPLPAIIMLWWLTPVIRPVNSIWMLGSMTMSLLIYPCVHKARWRFSVHRVQYLYSFAHLVAVVNHFTGRTKGWIATGATKASTPIACSVRRVMASHAAVTEAAVWLGLVHGTLIYGWHPFWAMYLLAGANAYIVLPAVMTAVRPAITPTLAALRRRAVLPKRRLHFRLPRREKLDPAADWIARVVRITALPPEFQARVAA